MKRQALKSNLLRSAGAVLWLLAAASFVSAQSMTKVLVLDDPLTTSRTIGTQRGGQLSSEGWKTKTALDYIQYSVPTVTAGELSFDVKGIYASNEVFPNIDHDKTGAEVPGSENVHYNLFCMWDDDVDNGWYGVSQWHNPYKCYIHIYGYTAGDLYKWRRMKLRLNVAAFNGGYEDDPHAFEDPAVGPFDWEKTRTYHHRLIWGEGKMLWYMDDVLLKTWDYSSFGAEYAPPDHRLRLGSGLLSRSGGLQVPIGIVYSNFKLYRYQDVTPPQVVRLDPQSEGEGVSVDSDILVLFSEPMNQTATQAAFSVTPAVNGTISWVGNSLYFQPTGLLQANTTYTVRVTTAAKDNSGNALTGAFSGSFTTHALNPTSVGKYESIDITLVATGLASTTNRYRDVTLKGVFTGPSRTLEIEGFWDLGDIFKVRIAPTEVGTWTYRITSTVPSLNATGSFECVESGLHGFVRRNPARPYTFMYDDGTPWLWLGDTSWRGFTSLYPYESRWKDYIDLRSEQGYTAMHSIVVSYINGLGFWKNEGGTCFTEGMETKDYDRLNPGYFQWIDKRIDYANSKGIVPVIFLTWAQEYINFSEAQFNKYCRYLVARFAAKNVIWVITGEYEEIIADYGRPVSEYETWGQLIYLMDPYDHPITLHPSGRGTSAQFAPLTWSGMIMQQTPYTVRDIRRDRIYNKPVVNGEPRYFYPEDADEGPNGPSRVALWEIVSNGGYYTSGFFTTYAPDKGGYDPSALPEEQKWVEITNTFMKRIPYSDLDPHHEMISSGNLMAKPGKFYFAYHGTGGAVTLNLSGQLGSLPARWLNPVTGVVSATFTVQLGGTVSLTPPFSGDWVLTIGDELNTDRVPPLAPQELGSENQTTQSMTLTWQPPAAAADGDRASKYRILRDGVELAVQSATRYHDANLAEAREYLYEVYAIDDADNSSTSAASGQFRCLPDLQPPYLSRVTAAAADTIVAWFSEPVQAASAGLASNYQIMQGVPIHAAMVAADRLSVKLRTGTHQANKVYTLIARNILDQAGSPNRMSANNAHGYFLGTDYTATLSTPANYQWDWLHMGDTYYIDRNYTLLDIPAALQNLLWLKTANEDRQISSTQFVSFTIKNTSTIYVAFDSEVASVPAWLSGWSKTDLTISTSDSAPLTVYAKSFAAGSVQLGGNSGSSSGRMYAVLVKPDEELVVGKRPVPPSRILMMSN
jgi:hypothetical protein